MKLNKRVLFIFLFLFLGGGARFIFPDVLIITNPDTRINSLKKKEIRDIFLGREKSWDKDGEIILAILKDRKVHQQFLKKFIDKTPFQFRNYWREKVFLGEGQSPRAFETEKKLIHFVASTKGAIGYIYSRANRSIKIISIIEEKEGK